MLLIIRFPEAQKHDVVSSLVVLVIIIASEQSKWLPLLFCSIFSKFHAIMCNIVFSFVCQSIILLHFSRVNLTAVQMS